MDLIPNPNRKLSLADILNPGNPDAPTAPAGPPKRRLTMAEMLQESPLTGSPVPLVEAVERARPTGEAAPEPQESPQRRPEPRSGENRYNLYAKVAGKWVWQCDCLAADHSQALQQMITSLKPEHAGMPIRLEQDEA
ncbi:MAG TPA: hypothetical protein VFC78_08705 [Tepidisphaeraceae bacterium]|nr:hypothetical protein [Tepidisphaeraceae bacterium]